MGMTSIFHLALFVIIVEVGPKRLPSASLAVADPLSLSLSLPPDMLSILSRAREQSKRRDNRDGGSRHFVFEDS